MAAFIGLDLAWKATNESGICWLEGESGETVRCTRIEAAALPVEDLADEIAAVDGTVVVAIDAPLLCAPYTDHPLFSAQSDGEAAIDAPVLCSRPRWVDPEIGWRFGRYKVSAYPATAAAVRPEFGGLAVGLMAGMAAEVGFCVAGRCSGRDL